MILIGFLASLFIYFGDGPLWLYLDPSRYWYGACKDNWWTNLLYVNNFVHPSEQVGYVFMLTYTLCCYSVQFMCFVVVFTVKVKVFFFFSYACH